MSENEDLIQKAKDNARQNFRDGLNCAESVFKAILDTGVTDLPPETVALASGFGGGMGLSGNNCGALVGAIMAVGAVHGRRNPLEGTFQDRVDRLYGNPGLYRFFNGMPHEFKARFGALNCCELTAPYLAAPDSEWTNRDRLKNCMKMVVETAGMAMEYILKGKDEGYTQAFGENVAKKV
ncbi:MAG: C-GCAxxG-C-C family protein [Thermacetogeniaceae bacterium]|jgi:C_GCAxxG_C_C family probable redox protein